MFQSPLKTVAEKIKPTDTKSSVSSLRFDRSSDFKKFIKFIKNETEQLEKIKLPTTTEIKGRGGSKLPGAAGILGLGLFGLIASLFGGDDKGKGDNKFRVGGAEASSIPTVPPLGLGSLRPKAKDIGGTAGTTTTKFKKSIKLSSKQRKRGSAFFKNKKMTVEQSMSKLIKRSRTEQVNSLMKKFGYSKEKLYRRLLDEFRLNYENSLDNISDNISPEKQVRFNLKKLSDKTLEKMYFENRGVTIDDAVDEMMDIGRKYFDEFVGRKKLIKKLSEEITGKDIELLENLAKETEIRFGVEVPTVDAKEAIDLLDTDEFRIAKKEVRSAKKEIKFQKISGKNTPIARSFFGFTPKYALDDFFTSIGQKTKPFRDFISAPFVKDGSKLTRFGKTLQPAMSFGSKLLRGGGFGLDLFSAIFATAELIDGFIVGDNILTAYYDLGVAVHNAFQPDKTKLMFYITKSRDARKNAFTDKKNQEILQQINEAKKSQVNNNQVSAQEGSSGIVPFAKSVSSSPMGITMVPTIYSWKFITEKLYKQ